MDVKAYLSQAERLNQCIASCLEEIHGLRDIASRLTTSVAAERISHTRCTEAPFAKSVERIADLERQVDAEIDCLVALKQQMRETIDTVADPTERLVLGYRYMHGCPWADIGAKLYMSESAVRRCHSRALGNVILPESPIDLRNRRK